MRILSLLLFSAAVLTQQVAVASPESDALANCLKDASTGKDRKELVRWTLIAMSAHPEMKGLATVDEATRKQADQQLAALMTRLLVDSCPEQARAAVAKGGPQDMMSSFRALGEVAMMELISNPEVMASFGSYTQYLDKKKFEAVLAPK